MEVKLLRITDLSKKYGEHHALKHVSLHVNKGEIIGIVGENGSGKSTLLKTIYGSEETRDYEGMIFLDSKELKIKNPYEANDYGIGMVHQELSLIDDMTVSQNIKITRENTKILGYLDSKKDIREVDEMIGDYGLSINSRDYIKNISLNLKQFVEVLRETDKPGLKLLILDEATASLNKEDSLILMEIIKKIASRGISVIFVSHKLDEVTELCNRIIVLRDGVKTLEATNSPSKGYDLNEIVDAMIGRKIIKSERYGSKNKDKYKYPVISFKNCSFSFGNEKLQNINLEILKGEIFGITGLSGHGKSMLGYGVMKLGKNSGSVLFGSNQDDILGSNPKDIIRRGIMFLPDERKTHGLMLNASIESNITTAAIASKSMFVSKFTGFVSKNKVHEHTKAMIESLNIKCEGPGQPVTRLSGGNQQKVCIAKALTGNPELVFIGEPTRGIDIYSKEVILKTILDLNKSHGITFVIASSEIEELMRVCDRIAVAYESEICKIFDNDDDIYEELGYAIAGLGRSNENIKSR